MDDKTKELILMIIALLIGIILAIFLKEIGALKAYHDFWYN